MNQNKKIGIIIDYEDFLKISDEKKQEMLECQYIEWFVFIKKDRYDQLSEEEKQKLEGFKCTEREPLRIKKVDMNKIFEIKEFPKLPNTKYIEAEMKEKHKKKSKPYVPLKMGIICTKKKGGR